MEVIAYLILASRWATLTNMLTCKEINGLMSDVFTSLLRPHGFRKTRLTWRREHGEITHIVNIQKSAWDPDPYHCSYYINLRVLVRKSNEPVNGAVSTRLTMVAPEYSDSLLRFEGYDPSEAESRVRRVCSILLEKGLPWLSELSSLEAIKAAYESGVIRHMVDVDVLRAIGVTKVTDRTGTIREL